jgi:hypothetical protein
MEGPRVTPAYAPRVPETPYAAEKDKMREQRGDMRFHQPQGTGAHDTAIAAHNAVLSMHQFAESRQRHIGPILPHVADWLNYRRLRNVESREKSIETELHTLHHEYDEDHPDA